VPNSIGTHVDIWDGTDDEGRLAPAQPYSVGVWAWDLPENALIVAGRPIVADVSKNPDYFFPGLNPYGQPEHMEIRYWVSKPAEVTMTVEDAEGRVHRTIVQNRAQAGVATALWDGRNAGGNLLYPGVYRIGFVARDAAGTLSMKIFSQFMIEY
jgi:hypothetical protein